MPEGMEVSIRQTFRIALVAVLALTITALPRAVDAQGVVPNLPPNAPPTLAPGGQGAVPAVRPRPNLPPNVAPSEAPRPSGAAVGTVLGALGDFAGDISSVELVLDPGGFLSEIVGLDFSPDGRLVAAAGDYEVRIWEVASGELKATLRGDRNKAGYGGCNAVAFSPDGKEMVVGINDYSGAGSLRVYDMANLTEMKELVQGHEDAVRRLAFSRDGRWLASSGANGKIRIWDWRRRQTVSVIEPPDPKNPILDVLCFPGSEPALLAVGFGGPRVYSVPDGKFAASFEDLPASFGDWIGRLGEYQFPYGKTPQFVAMRLDRGMWACAADAAEGSQPRYWAAAFRSGQVAPAARYERHDWSVKALAISADGRLVASGDRLGVVRLWLASDGSLVRSFSAAGRSIYDVGFEADEARIAFGVKPSAGAAWRLNSRGVADRVFDLSARAVSPLERPSATQERLQIGSRIVEAKFEADHYEIRCAANGRMEGLYSLRSGITPTTLTLLQAASARRYPTLIGNQYGGLVGWDPGTDDIEMRSFAGHDNYVTAVAEASSGKYVISSSTDRTMRLWALDDYRPTGNYDFVLQDDTVIKVPSGSHSETAGIRVGDRFVALDGKRIKALEELKLKGTYPYLPGQRVTLSMERRGEPYRVELTLAEHAETVQPLLSVFFPSDDEWIIWTPEGYYDSSPGADRMIGFHVNRGPAQSARFYGVGQFKQLYRPDVIDKILGSGARDEDLPSLAEKEAIQKSQPPMVRIVDPIDGSKTAVGKTAVRVSVRSLNDLPVRQVRLLLNGSPLPAKRTLTGAIGKEEIVEFEASLVSGNNKLDALATNSVSTSQPQSIQIDFAEGASASSIDRPSLYAVAVGVSKYSKASDINLKYAHRDAEAFVRLVEAQRGGALYGNVETRLITDGEADRAGFHEGLKWLRTSAVQGDVVMLFVSAHGFRDEFQTYFLGTHDIDPENLAASGISSEELTKMLEDQFPPCKKVLFMDTCHSGGVTGRKGIFDPVHDLATHETGTIVYASSTPREISRELDEHQHGAFTLALRDAMTDKISDLSRPEDGFLGVSELKMNLADRVKKLTGGTQHPVMESPSTLREFNLFQIVSIPD